MIIEYLVLLTGDNFFGDSDYITILLAKLLYESACSISETFRAERNFLAAIEYRCLKFPMNIVMAIKHILYK